MTLEKLLGLSADQWEQLSDEELAKWAEQFLHITRPIAGKPQTTTKQTNKQPHHTSSNKNLINQALAIAAQLGIKPKTK